jgi:hypothetical protein
LALADLNLKKEISIGRTIKKKFVCENQEIQRLENERLKKEVERSNMERERLKLDVERKKGEEERKKLE